MKRWLAASIALNLLMVGGVLGYLGASSAQFFPPPPPPGAEGGFQQVIVDTVMELPAARRDGAMDIIHAVRKKYSAIPRPDPVKPRTPEVMLNLFDAGQLPQKMPSLDNLMVNRKLNFEEGHEIAYRLQSYLTTEERHKVVQALRDNLKKMQKRLRKAGILPPGDLKMRSSHD